MNDVDIAAVLIAALATFVIGGPWYSPALFGKVWVREAGAQPQIGHRALVFGAAYVLSVIAAGLLALWLGPETTWQRGLAVGTAVGAGFVATSFGVNYVFGGRSAQLWLIDAGYHVVQFAAFGVILGAWPW